MQRPKTIRNMDLASFLTENTKLVEVYICSQKNSIDSGVIHVGWEKSPKLALLGQGQTQTLHMYQHRDMMYIYDRTNDAQRVVRKLLEKDSVCDHLYIQSFEEEILPSHRFPCTNDIVYETSISHTQYRINNRITICHDIEGDTHYVYVRYHHASNVDMNKMNEDMNKAIRKVLRALR